MTKFNPGSKVSTVKDGKTLAGYVRQFSEKREAYLVDFYGWSFSGDTIEQLETWYPKDHLWFKESDLKQND